METILCIEGKKANKIEIFLKRARLVPVLVSGLFWRRLLRVPWTARRSNQSILKEIHPEYSLEGLMLKLKCQYFGHLMQRADSLEKTLMLGKIEGRGEEEIPWDKECIPLEIHS